MRQFPAFFNMDDARVVVFGGGEEARRKVRLLARTSAQITVIVGKEIDAGFAEEFAGRITIAPLDHAGPSLDIARFAIIASRIDTNMERAITMARQYGVPINVVDRPDLCDFTVPSILDRGDVVAAVGTNGTAPIIAKTIRTKLEALMPQRLGDLAALAAKLRPDVKEAFPDDGVSRRHFWENVLSGPIADRVFAGELEGAETDMREALSQSVSGTRSGRVHIVGAGPGDPELLTLKALRLIQEADVVYYDRLVSADIMNLVRRDAARVSVGKERDNHSVPQKEIHKLLITAARQGHRVVRLKGGDPFVFGRGGEELAAVRAANVAVEVVPGISSAFGCAASAGLPLTHRDHAQSLTFVTGHAKEGGVPDLDWPSLARSNQTIVVFMGVGTSAGVSEKLIKAGRDPRTPIAVIANGTHANEKRAFGVLADVSQIIEREEIKSPALLIIGEVAALPEEATAQLTKELVE
ncbi:MAG: siroheme synthase CysG [Hyphomonas sp.]